MRIESGILVVAAAAALSGCVTPPSAPLEIDRAEVSQSQALPDFDTSTYVVTDAAELDRLAALLDEHGVRGDRGPSGEGCPGSLSTTVVVEVAGTERTIVAGSCEPDAFETELAALVTEWRESGEHPVAP